MAEEDKKKPSARRISDKERYKYVGFDVAPGRVKDLFKSDSEKTRFVEKLRAKREKDGGLHKLREECTLLEDRVTMRDRIFLAVACVIMVIALFLPWYAAYNEIVEETQEEAMTAATDSLAASDSMVSDSAAVVAETDSLPAEALAGEASDGTYDDGPKEEVIHGFVARKKVHKEYARLSGLGSLASIGNVGSHVFSAGFVVIITGVLFLVMTLLCVLLPAYTLFGLFGVKGDPDQKALRLKAILKLNWLPLALFGLALIISFIGADYGPSTIGTYTSLGDNYGVGAFLGSLSWGVFVTLAASIMLAVKSIEI